MDAYTYCNTNRLTPEAPCPVLDVSHVHEAPGMAMNVYENVNSFTTSVDYVTNENWTDIIKNRYVHTKTNHHFCRIDSGVIEETVIEKNLIWVGSRLSSSLTTTKDFSPMMTLSTYVLIILRYFLTRRRCWIPGLSMQSSSRSMSMNMRGPSLMWIL